MTHTPAPSGYHHDPERDTSCTWPHLTDDQRHVIGLLGYDAGHGRVPRLTVAEMATVNEVVRWAENRLNRPRSVPGMQGDAGGRSVAVQDDSAGSWGCVA